MTHQTILTFLAKLDRAQADEHEDLFSAEISDHSGHLTNLSRGRWSINLHHVQATGFGKWDTSQSWIRNAQHHPDVIAAQEGMQ